MDIFISSLLIIVFGLPIICICLILLVRFGWNEVFFFQERAGLNGIPFFIWKFKTISSTPDEISNDNGTASSDRFRIFLRNSSLDELPQLINILGGTMSLVGPRPLYVKYNTEYDSRQVMRLNVKPGLTGWAQVNGRNELPWAVKFEYDVFYVENYNLFFDIKILFRTVFFVLKRKNVVPFFNSEFKSEKKSK